MPPNRSAQAYPVEEFLQALSAQLDRAQDALALKARTGRPLTFALKDLSVELKVFWEVAEGRLVLRHAAPNEEGASVVHFSFTTITRAMVEENTFSLALEDDPRGIGDLGGHDVLDEYDRRKLELVGVRTVGQFKRLMHGADPRQMEALIGTPVDRLRMALERSSAPVVTGNEVLQRPDGRPLLKIRGANLAGSTRPRVRLSGEAVEVLDAKPHEILVRPMSHHVEGVIEVHAPEGVAEGFFDLSQVRAPAAKPAVAAGNGSPHATPEVDSREVRA
jgi:hypothetical protein